MRFLTVLYILSAAVTALEVRDAIPSAIPGSPFRTAKRAIKRSLGMSIAPKVEESATDVFMSFMDEEAFYCVKGILKYRFQFRRYGAVYVLERTELPEGGLIFERPHFVYKNLMDLSARDVGLRWVASSNTPGERMDAVSAFGWGVTRARLYDVHKLALEEGVRKKICHQPGLVGLLRDLSHSNVGVKNRLDGDHAPATLANFGRTVVAGNIAIMYRSFEMGIQGAMIHLYMHAFYQGIKQADSETSKTVPPGRGGIFATINVFVFGAGGSTRELPNTFQIVDISLLLGAVASVDANHNLKVNGLLELAGSDGKHTNFREDLTQAIGLNGAQSEDLINEEGKELSNMDTNLLVEGRVREAFQTIITNSEKRRIVTDILEQYDDTAVKGKREGSISVTPSIGDAPVKKGGKLLGLGDVNMEDYWAIVDFISMDDADFGMPGLLERFAVRVNTDPPHVTNMEAAEMEAWTKTDSARYMLTTDLGGIISFGISGYPVEEKCRFGMMGWTYPDYLRPSVDESERGWDYVSRRWIGVGDFVYDPFRMEISTDFLGEFGRDLTPKGRIGTGFLSIGAFNGGRTNVLAACMGSQGKRIGVCEVALRTLTQACRPGMWALADKLGIAPASIAVQDMDKFIPTWTRFKTDPAGIIGSKSIDGPSADRMYYKASNFLGLDNLAQLMFKDGSDVTWNLNQLRVVYAQSSQPAVRMLSNGGGSGFSGKCAWAAKSFLAPACCARGNCGDNDEETAEYWNEACKDPNTRVEGWFSAKWGAAKANMKAWKQARAARREAAAGLVKAEQVVNTHNEADLKNAFDYFDQDRSGAIDLEEFRQLMEWKGAGLGMTDEEVTAAFAENDTDGNNELSFDEFKNMMWSRTATTIGKGNRKARRDDRKAAAAAKKAAAAAVPGA